MRVDAAVTEMEEEICGEEEEGAASGLMEEAAVVDDGGSDLLSEKTVSDFTPSTSVPSPATTTGAEGVVVTIE